MVSKWDVGHTRPGCSDTGALCLRLLQRHYIKPPMRTLCDQGVSVAQRQKRLVAKP